MVVVAVEEEAFATGYYIMSAQYQASTQLSSRRQPTVEIRRISTDPNTLSRLEDCQIGSNMPRWSNPDRANAGHKSLLWGEGSMGREKMLSRGIKAGG